MRYAFLLVVCVLMMARAEDAFAAYQPAPKPVVKAAKRLLPPRRGTAQYRAWVVCRVFVGQCKQAVNVAWCESRLNPRARNGSYVGVFQLGEHERKAYGHGRSVWAQSIGALLLHAARGWQPWSCRPSR